MVEEEKRADRSEELEGWPAGQKMFESPSVAAAYEQEEHPIRLLLSTPPLVNISPLLSTFYPGLCQGQWALQQVNKLPPFQGQGS